VKPSRVVHYTFSTSGGAGRVAEQLSSGLNSSGLPSRVESLTTGNIQDCVLQQPILVGQALFDFFVVRRSSDQSLFSLFRNNDGVKLGEEKSTIHHLHWMPGVATVQQIGQLLKSELPKIWTLHDMWPFTGGCHHSMNCSEYTNSCSQCPQIRKPFQRSVDQSLRLKRKNFQMNRNFVAVTPSKWLRNRAQQSEIFERSEFRVIPNPINTHLFLPIRTKGNSFNDQLVVGCNATNLSDPMKGIDSLIIELESFQFRHPEIKVILLAIGNGKILSKKIEIRQTGLLSDQRQIVLAYSQMDIFVTMSKAEVFPLSIAEAQSCGLAVICLEAGGMPEMVQQGETGFVIASRFELGSALEQFIQQETNRKKLEESARNHALKNYSTEVVIDKYLDVYKSLILD
jgi:glycosyltransferase involved in cell wall biosynthesis